MAEDVAIRAVRGKALAALAGAVAVTPKMLAQLGNCLIKSLAREAKIDFAKRGWSGKDPMGGPPIWRSFHFRVRGKSLLEVTSTFYGMDVLARGVVPERRMTWLTQRAKDQRPERYHLTPSERRLRMKRGGRLSKGRRIPLVVPIKEPGGTVIFRTAPLTLAKAWVHPGIAKFTFFERGIRKGRVACAEALRKELVRNLTKSMRGH